MNSSLHLRLSNDLITEHPVNCQLTLSFGLLLYLILMDSGCRMGGYVQQLARRQCLELILKNYPYICNGPGNTVF